MPPESVYASHVHRGPADPADTRHIVSIHLIDDSVAASLRRKTPTPATTAGLRRAQRVLSAPITGSPIGRPQPSRSGYLMLWDDQAALDDFEQWHPLARDIESGWAVHLQPMSVSGAVAGLATDVSAAEASAWSGPVVGLTLGTVRPHRFPGLQRHNVQIERQLLDAAGTVWSTALAGPNRFLATLSIWESPAALRRFARSGAHAAGVEASVLDHDRRPRDFSATTYFSESAFAVCRARCVRGALTGRNPHPDAADVVLA